MQKHMEEEITPGRAETIELDTDKPHSAVHENSLVSVEAHCADDAEVHACDTIAAKEKLLDALITLEKARPSERSEQARRFAICITDMEKLFAYFHTYICDCDVS